MHKTSRTEWSLDGRAQSRRRLKLIRTKALPRKCDTQRNCHDRIRKSVETFVGDTRSSSQTYVEKARTDPASTKSGAAIVLISNVARRSPNFEPPIRVAIRSSRPPTNI